MQAGYTEDVLVPGLDDLQIAALIPVNSNSLNIIKTVDLAHQDGESIQDPG